MNSSNLRQQGFTVWYPFCPSMEKRLIASLPSTPGVYVIRSKKLFGRLQGASDIAYIGRAANSNGLKGRIRQYFHPGPTQSTNKRILSLITENSDFELGFNRCLAVAETGLLEDRLLAGYYREHCELPPLNRRM